MANFNLINSILKGVWLIDEGYVMNSLPLIKSMLEGKTVDFTNQFEFDKIENAAQNEDPDREEFGYYLRAVDGSTGRLNRRVFAYNDLPENSIAVIPNSGPMMRSDMFCGPAGTETKAEMIASANRSPKIKAIVVTANSPGGAADSVEVLMNAIKNSTKPVVTLVDSMSASASVWVTSPSDLIIASGDASIVGSIGTMFNYLDIEPALEKLGYKVHRVRATDSVDKNEDFYQMLKGNYKRIRSEMLDPLNDMFLNSMRENRPQMEKTFEMWHTGKIFFSDKAIEIGLADEKGDFDLAIKRAHQLADGLPIEIETSGEPSDVSELNSPDEQATNLQQNNFSNMKWKKGWSAALSFLGFGEQVAEADLPEITEAHIDTLNQGIVDAQADNARLQSELAQAQTALASMTTERDSWKTKAEEYGAQPGATPSTPKSEQDVIESTPEQQVQQAIDNMPHNKKADEFAPVKKVEAE